MYRGPCPNVIAATGGAILCNTPLYAQRGDTFITCPRCHTAHDGARLEQRHLADVGHHLFRVTHLLGILAQLGEPVSTGAFYNWRDKGKIRPAAWERPDGTVGRHSKNRADVALYRLVDVRKVRAASTIGQDESEGKTA